MFEPATVGAAIDPEGPISLLEPHRHQLDAAVLTVSSDDGRKDLLGKRLHFRAELDHPHTTSHLNSRVARTTEIASHTNMPSMSPRTAQSEAPSTLILRIDSEPHVKGEYCVTVCSHSGMFEREKKVPERNIRGRATRL